MKKQNISKHMRVNKQNDENNINTTILGKIREHITPINVVILLTVIAFILRIYHLDYNSLWLDEGSTYMFSHPSKTFIDIWNITASGEVHPPLFYWITHVMLIISNSEISIRLMPLVFGVLTIPAIYYLGKELHSELAGVISALLLTISQFHIFYSQEARSYTMLLFLSIIVILLWRNFVKKNTAFSSFLLGVGIAISFWTHFWSIIVIFPIVTFVCFDAIKHKVDRTYALFSICVGALLSSPLIVALINIYNIRVSQPIYWGVRGMDLLYGFFNTVGYGNIVMIVLTVVLMCFGIYIIYVSKSKQVAYELIFIFIFGVLLSIIMSYSIPMMPRYLMPLLAVVVTMCGVGISILLKHFKYVGVIILVCVIIMSSLALIPYYSTYTRENWRGYAEILGKNTIGGETIIILPDYLRNVFDFYYNSTSDNTLEYGVYNSVQLLDEYSSKNGTTIYIFTSDISATDPEQKTVAWIKENARYSGEYYGIHTYVRQL